MSNAMDRIGKLDEEKPIMSLDEQLAVADEMTDPNSSEFFGGMSPAAKEAMSNSILNNSVTLEAMEDQFSNEEAKPKVEVAPQEPEKDTADEELFNNNTEEKKQRGRPKRAEAESASDSKSNAYDPIMEQLAKDLLGDLRKQKYTYGNFNAAQTKLILDYICNKI